MTIIKSNLNTAKSIKGKFSKTVFQPSQMRSKIIFSSSTNNIIAEDSVETTVSNMATIVDTAFTYIKRDAGRIEKLASAFDECDQLMQKSVKK